MTSSQQAHSSIANNTPSLHDEQKYFDNTSDEDDCNADVVLQETQINERKSIYQHEKKIFQQLYSDFT